MIPKASAQKVVLPLLASFVLTLTVTGSAVTIVSGPSFTPSVNAPLAGLLQVTSDVPSRVSVQMSNGTNLWQRNFYDYSTAHSIQLLGFMPRTTNSILVTVYDKQRNASTAPQPLTFITPALPQFFPVYTILTNNPAAMEPGYMFFTIRNNSAAQAFITMMDNNGNVVWYMRAPNFLVVDVQFLDNGNIFIPGPAAQFTEYDMLGNTLQTWTAPSNYPINTHDGYPTAHGTILYLSDQTRVVSNFPTSDTVPNAPTVTTNIDDNPAVELSITNSGVLHTWSPIDLGLLDPTRVTYLTYDAPSPSYGVDNEHANALVEDTNDNSLIISMRNQNEVVKFDRTSGQVKWILGSPTNWGSAWQPYLLTPVGTPFDWNYGQHAPNISAQGTVLVYNDNNYAASPFDTLVPDQNNFSSGIEYSIDTTNMEVSEVWNSSWQTNQDRLFTPYIGRVQSLTKTTNVLVNFGAITYINGAHPSPYAAGATMVRIKEYTHDAVPQVVFDADFFNYTNTSPAYAGNFCYRAFQIPDLYVHPATPVTDLAVTETNDAPVLEFANDPFNSYMVEASTDLIHWTCIGTATESGNSGEFSFTDPQAGQFTSRFYRVVTQ